MKFFALFAVQFLLLSFSWNALADITYRSEIPKGRPAEAIQNNKRQDDIRTA